ncbi:MAG: aldo/keto reductase [Candidatus Electrothrix sp. GW3-4]|uniref:aldo/keto reductase n=1 Tax=Candidatus Electrothrix sp. GW3-4 TaxID=3126740 RepID=UPI0030D09D17
MKQQEHTQDKIPTRTFGRTGLEMPVLSLGMMRSRYSPQDIPLDQIAKQGQQELADLVDRALSLGITHLETARNYGSSERQLAPILERYPRDAFILQTKVRPEDDPELFTANVLDSLDRLGQERVDLLALHGLNNHQSLWQVCRPGGCLAAARKLQAQGKVGWVGFSGHGDVDILLKAIAHQEDGGFDYMNLHWYTVYQRNTPALAAAAAQNMGVFIISPTDKGGMLHTPPACLKKICTPLSPIQFNDLFCLQRPEVQTISIGAAQPSELGDHLNALSRLDDHEMVQGIYQQWQELMEKEAGLSRPDALWSSLPAWQQTPGYINIGMILWLYNLARGWDLLAFSRRRYRMLGQDMPWVPGLNGAVARQYDLEGIAAQAGMPAEELIRMLEKAHALLGEQGDQ